MSIDLMNKRFNECLLCDSGVWIRWLIFGEIIIDPDFYQSLFVDENHIVSRDEPSILLDQGLKTLETFVGYDNCLGIRYLNFFQSDEFFSDEVVMILVSSNFMNAKEMVSALALALLVFVLFFL